MFAERLFHSIKLSHETPDSRCRYKGYLIYIYVSSSKHKKCFEYNHVDPINKFGF